MEITKQPANIHTGFNPVTISMTDGTATSETISIEIDGNTYTKKREFFNEACFFDLSKIITSFFKNIITVSSLSSKILIDSNLFVDYTYTISETTYNKTALNAVVQIGESSDMTTKKNSFLTKFEKIYLYSGYERLLTAMTADNGSFINIDGSELTDSEHPITNRIICIKCSGENWIGISNKYPSHYLETESSEAITNELGDIITISDPESGYSENRMPIKSTCIPLNPFYVRWINQQGGYDYWMFEYKQTKKETAKLTTYSKFIENQETATETKVSIYCDSTNQIICGSSGLNENEFSCLKKIKFSPKIEFYDKEKDTWFSTTISDCSTEEDTYSSLQDIEVTFNLADEQTQF